MPAPREYRNRLPGKVAIVTGAGSQGEGVGTGKAIAVVMAGEGIRANTVAPGHILTPLPQGLLGEEARAMRRKVGPLGIEGDAWDVAAATLFLASDEARFITGELIAVDGGVLATGPLTAHALINRPE